MRRRGLLRKELKKESNKATSKLRVAEGFLAVGCMILSGRIRRSFSKSKGSLMV